MRIIDRRRIAAAQRNRANRSIQEHPFHQRHRRITGDQALEDGQVNGKRQRTHQADHVACNTARPSRRIDHSVTQDQQQRTRSADCDANRLFPRNRLFEVDGGDQHRQDRHGGSGNRCVDRRGHGQPYQERGLVKLDAEERCEEKQNEVLSADFLAGSEERCDPEKQSGPAHTEQIERIGRHHAACKHPFGDRHVETEHRIRQQQCQMPFHAMIARRDRSRCISFRMSHRVASFKWQK